jgi:hypothetical protein
MDRRKLVLRAGEENFKDFGTGGSRLAPADETVPLHFLVRQAV